jgi:hypothetical protein
LVRLPQKNPRSLKLSRSNSEQAQEANARETQALFDRFITEQERLRETAGDADLSLNIMIRPEKDAERDLVDALRKQLDAERERFTQAALKLGEDKAKLEVICDHIVVDCLDSLCYIPGRET